MKNKYNRYSKTSFIKPLNIIVIILIIAQTLTILLGFYFTIRNDKEVNYPSMSYTEFFTLANDTDDTTILTDLETIHIESNKSYSDLSEMKITGNYQSQSENKNFQVFVSFGQFLDIQIALSETDQDQIITYYDRRPDDNEFIEFLIKNRFTFLKIDLLSVVLYFIIKKIYDKM